MDFAQKFKTGWIWFQIRPIRDDDTHSIAATFFKCFFLSLFLQLAFA